MTAQDAPNPLHADEAEKAVLSCLFLEPQRYGDVSGVVSTDDFRQIVEQRIYRTITEVVGEGASLDPCVIVDRLKTVPPPNGMSWRDHLVCITELMPHAGNAMRFANAVHEAATRRRLRNALSGAISMVESGNGDIAEIAAETAGLLDSITIGTQKGISTDVIGIPLSSIERQDIRWLWPARIALGKMTMLSGNPGVGKSFISLDLAARITTGHRWPDDTKNAPLGSVIILADEDDPADTIRPRLEAAGADIDKVRIVKATSNPDKAESERWIDLTKDLTAIEAVAAKSGDCRLIIIDPISAYMGETRSHDNAEVRGVLGPMGEMASRLDASILLINHLRKGDGDAMSRSMGSVGFVASCRAVFAVAKDKDDPTGTKRLFLPIKNNLGNDSTGLSFSLLASMWGGPQPSVAWDADPVTTSADEALAPKVGRKPIDRKKAEEFLTTALAGGPRPSRELEDEAEGQAITRGTLKRARKELNVAAFRDPPGKGPWFWRLPARAESRSAVAEEQQPDTESVLFCSSA